MSVGELEPAERTRPWSRGEVVAGFLAAAAMAAGGIAVVYRPVRLGVPAIIMALVAAGMARRHNTRVAMAAVLIATACWVVGMTVAVITKNPLW